MGIGEHQPPVAEPEEGRCSRERGLSFTATTALVAVERTAYTMADYKDHIGPFWPGYPGIANLIIL